MKKQHGNIHEIIVRKVKPLIVLIGIPILFSLLFSACFGTVYVNDIPIAICDLDGGSQAATEMIQRLEAGGGLKVIMETDSTSEMKEAMLMGKIQEAVIFPKGFASDYRAAKNVKAMCLVNGANFLISNNAMLYTTSAFTAVNKDLRIKLLENGDIIPYSAEQIGGTLSFTDRILFNPQMSYLKFIILGIVGIIIQQTYLTMFSALLVFTKERLPEQRINAAGDLRLFRHGIFKELGKTACVYGSCSIVGLIGALIAIHHWFDIPLNGNIIEVLLLMLIFLLDMTAVSLVVGSFFKDEAHCVQFDMFLAIPTMLTCGYAWPEFMMPALFAPVLKEVWPLYYFSVPLRDLLLKGTDLGMLTSYITGGLLFAAFWLPVGAWLYARSFRKCQTGSVAAVPAEEV